MGKLSKEELEKLKKKLLVLRARVAGALDTTQKEALSRDISEMSTIDISDFAEVGADNFEQELSLDIMEGQQELIREIDDALERMRNKTYGTCEGCSKIIPKSRLNAIPYARLCVECQREEEGLSPV